MLERRLLLVLVIHNKLALQVIGDFGELRERSFQVFDDLSRNYVWIGEVGAVFEAFVFEPEDVEVEFVALC